MQKSDIPPSQDLITIAERTLSKRLGSTIQLSEGEDLHGGSRTNVYRFSVLNRPSDAPKSVIVKQVQRSPKVLIILIEQAWQRYLMRSDVVVKTTEEFGHMKAIGATTRAMAVKMRQLWPDVEETPYYPAFR